MKIIYEAPKAIEIVLNISADILAGSLNLGLSSGEDIEMESEYNPW